MRFFPMALLVLISWFAMAQPLPLDERVLAFRAALSAEQFAKLEIPFNDEARLAWSFLPGARKGLPMKELDEAQRGLLSNVVKTALSESGFATVETIRRLDDLLRELGGGPERDSTLYFAVLFGDPASGQPWGFRFEGHHVSLSWTVVEGKVVSSTPQFLGSNPGEAREGSMKGTRALAAEEDLGRSLVQSLTEAQRLLGVISATAPTDILTKMDREAAVQEDKGIAYTELTPEQQGILLSLIEHCANVQAPPLAAERLQKLRDAGIDKVKFAWMGGLAPGEGHYYRVQGPTFLIEYDNTQNNANHVHTVWRDFKGDFGMDVLKLHYEQHAPNGDAQGHDK